MSGAADTFAAFLEVLTEALDDHEATGADLARRAHLSRHHFDRVIAAVAGEAPGQFRRRVLLERAAHRLVSSPATILDVAIEAGYSSHEAFTRAFTRAYGTAPAHWRRQPTAVALPTPNGIHFHPPASLRVPSRERASSMDLVVTLVRHHVWLLEQMVARAAQMDNEQLDRPIQLSIQGIDAQPSLRGLLSRLIGQMQMWNAAIDGEEYDFAVEAGESVEHMRQRLAGVGPVFGNHVREILDQGRLDEAIICPGEPVEVYTLGGVIAHVLTFAAYRRTLVAGALAGAGFDDLDGGDPVRWVEFSAA